MKGKKENTDNKFEQNEELAAADAALVGEQPATAGSAQTTTKEKSFAHINTKAFITVLVMLLAVILIAALLPLFIPQGHYDVIDGEYIFTYGEVKGIAAWRVITAPFRVFASEDALNIIMISLFLLIMSGVFNIIEKTGGVKSIIERTTRRFSSKKKIVLCLTVFIFMAFGSFFGMFEELVTLLPIVVSLALFLGFDTLTGLGMCMMAACFGFSSAITNPFSVGIASNMLNVAVMDGMYMRVILFALIFAIVCGYLLLHIRRISKNPQKSLTYDLDREKLKKIMEERVELSEQDKRVFKTYIIFFAVQLVILVVVASVRAISGYAIPILSVSFLVGGLVCGGLLAGIKKTLKWLGQGVLSMLPAIVMIALASSVKLIMSEGGIIDTVLHAVIEALKDMSVFESILLIYALVLFLQIFIGSASAKIMLIMPILRQLCGILGISPNLVILTYCMADGFTDMILPTNPVLLIGLSMTGVSYGKWFRFTWMLQLAVFALTVLMLYIATQVGY